MAPAKPLPFRLERRDYVRGLVASGPKKGIVISCAYCGRPMSIQALAHHVPKKHPRRRKCV